MKDEDKTRDELINELVELRQRIAELEASETERKRAEEEVRRLATIARDSNDAITVQDFEGNITAWNHGAEQMYGWSEAEALAMNIRDTIPEDKRKEASAFVKKLAKGEIVPSLETQRFTKDGRIFDVWLTVTALVDEAGKPVAIATTERDITERKRTEEALRESESRLRSILSSMVDLVFVFDNEGRFIFYHCPSSDLLYIPPEKFMGKKHSEVMPLYVDKLFAKAFNKNKKEEVAEYEYCLEVGGETKWYSVKLSPMLLDDEFAGSVAVIRDITERKRAEEPLKRAALETLEALSRLVEANDPYTSGHSTTVTEIAIKIAQKMGLQDGPLDILCIAGPLHDVGKVGIPSSVLNKPTGLTEAEWVMVKAHPQVSAAVAQQVTAFQVAVPVIRHHHERWDGTGYPNGLKGDDIPLLARILAVADGFQAMTSERPYRRARTEAEALEELHKGAGTQWDPEVVKVFLKLQKPPTKRKGKGERKSRK